MESIESIESELEQQVPGPKFTPLRGDARVQVTARRVLVVEDDPAQREALAEVLVVWGYEPLLAASAEEALFAVRHKRVDAALVDIVLPGRSGSGLLSKLRAQFPEAVLVAMSAL